MQALLNLLEQTQTAVAVSGLVLLLLIEHLHPFFDFFKHSRKKRWTHFYRNIILGLVNVGFTTILFVGIWLWASNWAISNEFGILNWLGLSGWLHLVGAVLLMDTWTYFWHVMNHKIPFFWRFHRVHHSDPNMDVTTANRFHIGEIIFSSILRTGIILIVGLAIWELLVYEIMLVIVVQFHHANIGLPEKVDKFLRLFIVTPAMHKVHHSRKQSETDSNYSSLFSFWDRIGRTFNLNKDLHSIHLGLDEFDSEEDQNVKGLFYMPFKKNRK
ncbi:MAG: sterol desaturase family protein [Gracilimonas sp.]|jgi:sterol desaturase/sphingolipid hydroxylase (fatty acid hydroxylase superfamily)|nr:sterol desaturase family protein [Gracilimonas sp.]